MRTDDLRWQLLEQLAEKARFGSEGNPQVCNLRRGSPITVPTSGATPCASRGPSRVGSRPATPVPEEPPKLERRQGDFHEMAWAELGVCNMCGANRAGHGCKTCGLRLCGGKAGYGFMGA